MGIKFLLSAFVLLGLTRGVSAIVIEQLNGAFTLGTDWSFDSVDGRITIITPSATETYVFWAHTGDGSTLASISLIERDSTLTSGTVKFKISQDLIDVTAGATDIGAITLDTAGIQTELEGLNITGDILASQGGAMSLDTITGTVIIGGAVRNAMTINGALEGSLAVTGTVDGSLSFNGDVNDDITLEQPLTNPLTVTGSVNGVIRINNSNGPGPGLASGADILIAKSGGVGGNLSGRVLVTVGVVTRKVECPL